jgi:hypothetical protein
MAARDPKKPVLIDLENGDSVTLITWEFVVDKFSEILSPILSDIEDINTDLAECRDKIKYLADHQPED